MRTLLTTLWMLTLLAALPLSTRAADDRPNFVVIIADDMAWNDAGCYGHPHIRTPHIDKLAADGMRFTTAWLTCSSCSPSRSSIMTGRYPHATGAAELHMPLPADRVMFTTPLREAGYYCASAGKWHLGDPAKDQVDRIYGTGGPSGCGEWVKALKERPKDKPFFFWLAAVDPHRGYQKNTIDKPHTRDDVVVPPFLPDTPEVRDDLAMYYDEITRMDGFIGDVLAELEAQGVAQNTVVVFLSDNGRPFPRCKTTVYDSGVKTPFIVRWPAGVKAGSVSESLVSSVDIAPTLLALAGIEAPESFQGRSFAPVLADPSAKVRDYLFAEHNWHDYEAYERGARDGRYLYIRNWRPQLNGSPPADAVNSPTYRKMIQLHEADQLTPAQRGCFVTPRPEEELYDTDADPFQLTNLAADPHHAEALKRMRAALDGWRQRTGDEFSEPLTPDLFDRWSGKKIGQGARPGQK